MCPKVSDSVYIRLFHDCMAWQGGGFDPLWSSNGWGIWPSKRQHSGEFDQIFSKKSNAPGFARGDGRFWNWPVHKIHKHGNLGRPIASSNGQPTERISQFVDYYLKPLVHKTASFIKDTTHFLNKLDQLGHLPSNAILVTLDVSSLYTNIPHNEGIDACQHYLNTRDQSTSIVTHWDSLRPHQDDPYYEQFWIQQHLLHTAHAWLHHTLTYSLLNLRQTHFHMRCTSHTPGGASSTTFSWSGPTQKTNYALLSLTST